MNSYDLFPEVLPFDKNIGRELALRLKSDPNDNLIQGKSLEGVLARHLSTLTKVELTAEDLDNQWWDIFLPELKTPMRIDAKSTSAHSYTVSTHELEMAKNYPGLFVWALYKVDGDTFVRRAVFGKLKGSELWGPPLLSPSLFTARAHSKPTFYWDDISLEGRETVTLNQLNELNLL